MRALLGYAMMGRHKADMEINVLIDDDLEGHLEVSWLQGVAEQVLAAQDAGSGVELGLVITGQEKVQQLNRRYLGRDEPTDVLAFSKPVSYTHLTLPTNREV